MSDEMVHTKIGRYWYDLHLDQGSDPEWPWMVNAYRSRPREGWRYPDWFCVGRSRDDAIERVAGHLLAKNETAPSIRGET